MTEHKQSKLNVKNLRRLELLDSKSRKERIRGQRSSGANADINITPLVDVVLVLLIIFMVVTPMLNDEIDLPKTVDPKKMTAMAEDLKIIVDRNGKITVDKEDVPVEKIGEKLSRELDKNPFRPVYLAADRSLQFASLRKVLVALRESGVSEAGLLSTHIDGGQ